MLEQTTPFSKNDIGAILTAGECNALRSAISTKIGEMTDLIDLLKPFTVAPHKQHRDLIFLLLRVNNDINTLLEHLSKRWPE